MLRRRPEPPHTVRAARNAFVSRKGKRDLDGALAAINSLPEVPHFLTGSVI